MYYYLYRIRGGEVVTASSSPISEYDSTYFAVFEDETNIDLSPPKICEGDPLEIRVATPSEINYFTTAKTADERAKQRTEAVTFMEEGEKLPMKRILYALLIVIKSEINILRVAAGLPERSLSQLKTAITNIIQGS